MRKEIAVIPDEFSKERAEEASRLFSQRLRTLRRAAQLTQEDMARMLQLHRTAYTRYERGDAHPDQLRLLKLASFFEVSVDYLLGGEEEKRPAPFMVELQEGQVLQLTALEQMLLTGYRNMDERQRGDFIARMYSMLRPEDTL